MLIIIIMRVTNYFLPSIKYFLKSHFPRIFIKLQNFMIFQMYSFFHFPQDIQVEWEPSLLNFLKR